MTESWLPSLKTATAQKGIRARHQGRAARGQVDPALRGSPEKLRPDYGHDASRLIAVQMSKR